MMQMDQRRRCRLLDQIPKRSKKCNAASEEEKDQENYEEEGNLRLDSQLCN